MTYYKVLGEGGVCCNGGTGEWNLPTRNADGSWTPGEWMPAIEGELVACRRGYHLCRDAEVLAWLNIELYEAEFDGECIEVDYKVVARRARLLRRLNWDERVARLFACDCAEHVLANFVRQRPGDTRPQQAIETARRYANGQATQDELRAAWSAARAAAWDATRDAAWDAAWSAARAAAWDATRAAAWDAARNAAWDAEKKWQYKRLREYLDGVTDERKEQRDKEGL